MSYTAGFILERNRIHANFVGNDSHQKVVIIHTAIINTYRNKMFWFISDTYRNIVLYHGIIVTSSIYLFDSFVPSIKLILSFAIEAIQTKKK
eukprot:478741_1